jgi:hypothetical protein
MRKYLYRKGDGWSGNLGLTKLMAVAGMKIVAGKGPFVITQDGDPIGVGLNRLDCLARLRSVVKNKPLGPVFRVRKANGDVVFACRAVKVDYVDDSDTTSGNERADIYWNVIRDTFRGFAPRFAGAYVCKTVVGTSTLSQHSYGNADDVFFDTLAHQEQVADWVVAHQDLLHPFHVISARRIWTKGVGWRYYTGDFHSHLHVDFDPQYSGPCGVRG